MWCGFNRNSTWACEGWQRKGPNLRHCSCLWKGFFSPWISNYFFCHVSSRIRQMKKKIKYFLGSLWRSPCRPVFIMFQRHLDWLLKSRMSGRCGVGDGPSNTIRWRIVLPRSSAEVLLESEGSHIRYSPALHKEIFIFIILWFIIFHWNGNTSPNRMK